jgi:hypothetical protein
VILLLPFSNLAASNTNFLANNLAHSHHLLRVWIRVHISVRKTRLHQRGRL